MSNLTHIFSEGQRVNCKLEDGRFEESVIKEVHEDHLIIDVPCVSDHCWYEEGFNLDKVFPIYNDVRW